MRIMIGYFGKLPGSADFISHHAASEDVQAFDECLQSAMRGLMEMPRWEAAFDRLPYCSFLFRASAQHWLAGELISARDASRRRYPMMVFQRLPMHCGNERFSAPWTVGEVQAKQLGDALDEAVCTQMTAQAFAARMDAVRPLAPADLLLHQRLHERVLEDTSLQDISEAISAGYPEFILNAVLHRLTGLSQLCERMPMPPVRLPLPADSALMRPLADIWLHWLARALPDAPRLAVLVHDDRRPSLLVFSGDDGVQLYRLLAGSDAAPACFDVLAPFERFDPARAQTELPDPSQSIGSCMLRYTGRDVRTVRHP